jgi:hypothetical protein
VREAAQSLKERRRAAELERRLEVNKALEEMSIGMKRAARGAFKLGKIAKPWAATFDAEFEAAP